jgi:hypothetical protein
VIDVTRRSIEETAATIIKLLHEREPTRDEAFREAVLRAFPYDEAETKLRELSPAWNV